MRRLQPIMFAGCFAFERRAARHTKCSQARAEARVSQDGMPVLVAAAIGLLRIVGVVVMTVTLIALIITLLYGFDVSCERDQEY